MNGVNLIPAFRREQAARRTRIRVWSIALAATLCISGLGASAFRAAISLDIRPVRAEIAVAKAAAEQTNQRLVKVRGEVAKLKQAELASRMVGEHPDWSLLLHAIDLARGDTVSLETFDLKLAPPPPPPAPPPGDTKPVTPPKPVERYLVKIRGVATDLSGVMLFVKQLESLGVMESVAMKQSRTENQQGVAVTGFDLECALAERSAPSKEASASPSTADATPRGDRP